MEQLSQHLGGKAKVYKANVANATGAAGELGVMGLPTVVIFKDGQEVDRMVGGGSLDALKARVEKVTG